MWQLILRTPIYVDEATFYLKLVKTGNQDFQGSMYNIAFGSKFSIYIHTYVCSYISLQYRFQDYDYEMQANQLPNR